MNICFKNTFNHNIFNINKISKSYTQFTFKGIGPRIDIFESRTEQLAIIRKEKMANLNAELEKKNKKLAKYIKTYGKNPSISLLEGRLSKKKYYKIISEMEALKNEISKIKEELARLIYEDKYYKNPNTAFLYNPDLTSHTKSILLKEKSFIKKASDIGREILGDSRYGRYWTEIGYIQADEVKGKLYIDTNLPKNKDFLEFVQSTKGNMVSYFNVQTKYNMDREKLDKTIKSGIFKLAYGDINSIEKYIRRNNWYLDISSDDAQKNIEDHIKITPQKSKYFKDNKKPAVEVPISVLIYLGFGNQENIKGLVNSGEIQGRTVSVEKNGKQKRITLVNINDPNTEIKLKTLRRSNKHIYEIENLSQKIGMPVSEIERRVLNEDGEIIKYFIFPSDSNKKFLDLSNIKNQKFANMVKEKENKNS